jgi:hypothetical protein
MSRALIYARILQDMVSPLLSELVNCLSPYNSVYVSNTDLC